MPLKRQRSTAQVRIAHTYEGVAMYVKEEFVYGEIFSQGGHCLGAKTARTCFWTVLVLSDDDEDSESDDELLDRVYARGGERREEGRLWTGAVWRPCGRPLLLGDANGRESKEANGSRARGSRAVSALSAE